MVTGLYAKQYIQKLRTPAEAALLIRSGNRVEYGFAGSFPETFDSALAERRDGLKNVSVYGAFAVRPVQVVEKDPERAAFTYNSWLCSEIERRYISEGRAFSVPTCVGSYSPSYKRRSCHPDFAVVKVGPIDENGFFPFGTTNGPLNDIFSSAKHIIVEVCDEMPLIKNHEESSIHISKVDYIIEGNASLAVVNKKYPSDRDIAAAKKVMPYLYDGVSLNLSEGKALDVLGQLIADSDIKDLGMHTELLSESFLPILQAGKISNIHKSVNTGISIFSFCLGSCELYNFINRNENIASAQFGYISRADIIKEINNYISIGSCTACDLHGLTFTNGYRIHSPFYEAENGSAFVVMPSVTEDIDGKLYSNIIPDFRNVSEVEVPLDSGPSIVTEFGVAEMLGKNTWERAEAVINIAHPDFREALISAAEKQKIWRASNKR